MKMQPQKDITWTQVQTHRWERDIDEVENFYTTLARRFQGTGRTFFAMTAHISFSVPRIESSRESTEERVTQALQKAWMRIRYDHPTIASWVYYQPESGRCRKVYETFPESQNVHILDWLNETFHIVSTSQSGQEWCNSDPPVPKRPTLFFLKHPVSSLDRCSYDLVLRSQHDIIDGIGSLHLLNNLFNYASVAFHDVEGFEVPHFGDETKSLSPPFRIAASVPFSLTTEQTKRVDNMIKTNSQLRNGVEIATVPFKSGTTVPGRHQRACLTLEPAYTAKLLASCKGLGASVTHVYHAALAIILRDIQERRPGERQVRYINYSLINERGHCRPPYNTPAHAVSVYHSVSGQSLVIDLAGPTPFTAEKELKVKGQEFLRVVEEVKSYYQAIRDDQEHVYLAPTYWALSTPPYPPGPEVPEIPSPNEAPSVSISSLGIIDKIISPSQGIFELYDPWVTGEELGTGLGLFLGTFRGAMCLSIAYNDAWHTEGEATNFINRCNSLVLECLEL